MSSAVVWFYLGPSFIYHAKRKKKKKKAEKILHKKKRKQGATQHPRLELVVGTHGTVVEPQEN